MWPNPQLKKSEEILNGKLHFLCSESQNFEAKMETKKWIRKRGVALLSLENQDGDFKSKALISVCWKATEKACFGVFLKEIISQFLVYSKKRIH